MFVVGKNDRKQVLQGMTDWNNIAICFQVNEWVTRFEMNSVSIKISVRPIRL